MISNRNKNNKKNNISQAFTKILLSIIFVLSSLIFTNINDKYYLKYNEKIINNNINFSKYRIKYEKYFGKIIKNPKIDTKPVFNEESSSWKAMDYLDGEKIIYNNQSNVSAIQSGIVVYIGEKENYGKTIIIQGIDDTDIWYGNLKDTNIKLYDYVEKGKQIAEIDNMLYIRIIKDKKNIKYNEYIKQI